MLSHSILGPGVSEPVSHLELRTTACVKRKDTLKIREKRRRKREKEVLKELPVFSATNLSTGNE